MELGSNYELNIQSLKETEDSVFCYLNRFDTRYMDSGRSAIRATLPLLEQGIVLLPDYICKSVTDMFCRDFEVQFYRVKPDFSIDLSDLAGKITGEVKTIYLMNYFGMLQSEEIQRELLWWKQKCGFTIIEDTTHSMFTSARTIGDYCICSLRKWFPIADGGVLYTNGRLPENLGCALPKKKASVVWDAMILKHWFLERNVDCNLLYRQLFEEEEERLEKQQDIFAMSDLSKLMLQYHPVKEIIKKRKRNYQQLAQYYESHADGEVYPAFRAQDFVPLTFPVYAKKRDELRSYLMEHRIYCAVHWPLEGTGLCADLDARVKSRHLLSLPIDQRYGEAHMEYLCSILDKFEG